MDRFFLGEFKADIRRVIGGVADQLFNRPMLTYVLGQMDYYVYDGAVREEYTLEPDDEMMKILGDVWTKKELEGYKMQVAGGMYVLSLMLLRAPFFLQMPDVMRSLSLIYAQELDKEELDIDTVRVAFVGVHNMLPPGMVRWALKRGIVKPAPMGVSLADKRGMLEETEERIFQDMDESVRSRRLAERYVDAKALVGSSKEEKRTVVKGVKKWFVGETKDVMKRCAKLMKKHGIYTKKQLKDWFIKNHPDKRRAQGMSEHPDFQEFSGCYRAAFGGA
jgi:hypothetical protein